MWNQSACTALAALLWFRGQSVLASVRILEDVQLGLDSQGLETTAGLYCSAAPRSPCERQQTDGIGEAEQPSPVVLVYPGFSGPKDQYSEFANNVAAAGYTVMVLQQLLVVQAPGFDTESQPISVITPTATEIALDWLDFYGTRGPAEGKAGEFPSACAPPDTRTVLIAAHSWGCLVALQVLAGNFSLPFPPLGLESVALPDSSDILGAFMYGVSAETFDTADPPSLPSQKILVANGEVEFIGDLVAEGNGTGYDAFIELADINHFAISDEEGFGGNITLVEEGDQEGFMFFTNFVPVASRSQEESVKLVSEVGIGALNSMLCGAGRELRKVPDYVTEVDGYEGDIVSWLSWIV